MILQNDWTGKQKFSIKLNGVLHVFSVMRSKMDGGYETWLFCDSTDKEHNPELNKAYEKANQILTTPANFIRINDGKISLEYQETRKHVIFARNIARKVTTKFVTISPDSIVAKEITGKSAKEIFAHEIKTQCSANEDESTILTISTALYTFLISSKMLKFAPSVVVNLEDPKQQGEVEKDETSQPGDNQPGIEPIDHSQDPQEKPLTLTRKP